MRKQIHAFSMALALLPCGIFAAVTPVGAEEAKVKTTIEVDLAGAWNPDAFIGVVGATRKTTISGEPSDLMSPYHQEGLSLAASPAFARASAYGEWMPHAVLQLRAQYSLYRYYGGDSEALLSFPSSDSSFGDDDVDRLEGEAESAWGRRILLSPVLRAKIGPVLLRNVTELSWFNFEGEGPYFLERENYTLLKDGDWLVSNSLQVMGTFLQGERGAVLYAGPFYKSTRAGASGITQQSTGLVASWTPPSGLNPLRHPRIFLQAGTHLDDPNRQGELFAVGGVRFTFGGR